MNKQKVSALFPAALTSVDRSAPDVRAVATAKPRPDPEVVPQAKRRRFTAEYKQRILTEADQAKGSGGIGALLRREGLYSEFAHPAWPISRI